MEFVLEAKGLVKRFGGVRALDGVNLALRRGDVFALVGENGAGKSTLLHVLLNLLSPDAGESTVAGRPLRKLKAADFQRIGYVSESHHVPEWMSTAQFLRFLRPFYPAWDKDLESALLKRLDLPLDRPLQKLSRGMRMKALLVSSLAYRPELLLLDEPFSGLDPLVREEILEQVLALAEPMTVLMASHDIHELERTASHVGYLERGRFLFVEETEALLGRFREVSFRVPEGARWEAPFARDWIRMEVQDGMVRFVDSCWSEATVEELRRRCGEPIGLELRTLSLREIVVALAKEERARTRKEAA